MNNSLVINKYEVALFPKDFYVSDLNSLLVELKKIDTFKNGVNTLIPLPHDAPREIPRLLLRSKDKTIGCNISFEKINIFWLNMRDAANFLKPISTIQSLVEKIMGVALSSTTQKVKRVGYIKEYFYETDKPVGVISGKTIQSNIAKRLKDFVLQMTYKLEDLSSYHNCNEVVILNSNGIKLTDRKKVIMLTHDINTIQTADVDWEIQKIKEFIEEANSKSNGNTLIERFFVQNVKE